MFLILTFSFLVFVDNSDFASGAILEQRHPSGWHPVEYFSKRLSSTEANYSATEYKLLNLSPCYTILAPLFGWLIV